MVTLEEKISLFKKMVDDKVQKEINEKLYQKETEINMEVEKEKAELSLKADREKKIVIDRLKKEKSEAVSSMIQKEKRNFLRLNEEILEDIITKVEDKIKNFMDESDYDSYLKRVLRSSIGSFDKESQLIVYIPPVGFSKGKQALEEELRGLGFQDFIFKEGQIADIGGFILENREKGIRVNRTFAEALHIKRDEIGQILSDYIRRGE